MYFLGFPVYRLDHTLNSVSRRNLLSNFIFLLVVDMVSNLYFRIVLNVSSGNLLRHQMAAAKDPDAAFFKKLDGFQPCELTELKAGTHVFAVYGL